MRKLRAATIAGVLAMAAMTGGSWGQTTGDAGAKAFASAANQFGMELYGKLAAAQPEGNLFFSPYSVDTALLMAGTGARGGTAMEFATVLRLGGDQAKMSAGAAEMMKELNPPANAEGQREFSLNVANGVWVDKGFPILPSFMDEVQKTFGTGAAFAEDFSHDPEGGRKEINGWVEEKTEKKITDLVPKGAVTPATRLVLANAIYFKASWFDKFEASATQDQPFHVGGGGTDVTAPLMHLKKLRAYAETDDVQIVQLRYLTSDRGQSDVSMLVILPKKEGGLAAVEKSLVEGGLSKWEEGMKYAMVDLYLPKWKTTSTLQLNGPLGEMGLKTAFTEGADFSGISASSDPANKLRISDVIHKAYVAVDENGTEAAAATAVVMVGSAMRREEPVTFRADRPFLYVIEHEPTKGVLFVGRVGDPTGA